MRLTRFKLHSFVIFQHMMNFNDFLKYLFNSPLVFRWFLIILVKNYQTWLLIVNYSVVQFRKLYYGKYTRIEYYFMHDSVDN